MVPHGGHGYAADGAAVVEASHVVVAHAVVEAPDVVDAGRRPQSRELVGQGREALDLREARRLAADDEESHGLVERAERAVDRVNDRHDGVLLFVFDHRRLDFLSFRCCDNRDHPRSVSLSLRCLVDLGTTKPVTLSVSTMRSL